MKNHIFQTSVSSNINEVIRSVLNFLFFFMIRSHKYKKALKALKAPKSIKHNQAKAQNANKRIKIKNALKKHLSGKK